MPTALLIVILLMPDGTYKDFVIHHDSMAACEAAMPEAPAPPTPAVPGSAPPPRRRPGRRAPETESPRPPLTRRATP